MGNEPSSPDAPMRATLRQELAEILSRGPHSLRALSQQLKIPEREVLVHLEHLRRSAAARGAHLVVEPTRCLQCGFEFRGRDRLKKPGRCPRCRSSHLEAPRYYLRLD